MPRPIPFIGPSYELDTGKADRQRAINQFPVTNEVAGGKTGAYFQSVPGLDVFSGPYVPPPIHVCVEGPAWDAVNTIGDNILWRSCVFGGDRFMAIGRNASNAPQSTTSFNGLTFTSPVTIFASNTDSVSKKSLAYSDASGTWFMCTASFHGARSTNNGLSWAPAGPGVTLAAVYCFDGVFYGVRSGSTTLDRSVDDGVTWTTVTLPATRTWARMAQANGVLLIMPSSISSPGAYSTNGGNTWVDCGGVGIITGALSEMAGDPLLSIFVATGTDAGGKKINYSTDNGVTWTATADISITSQTFSGCDRYQGVFIVTDTTGHVYTSTDGIAYTQSANDMPVGAGTWQIAFDGSETYIATQDDSATNQLTALGVCAG